MKNIESMLKQKAPKPNRSLNVNFTENVMNTIKKDKRPSRTSELLTAMRRRRVIGIPMTAFAGLVLVGGTAAAIALWPTPKVTPTITKTLPNGNRIVGVNATDCQYFSSLDGTANKPTNENIYYEVRKDSKLTDEQIRSMVQGICEENVSNNAISAIIKQLGVSSETRGIQSTEAFVVNAIDDKNITVSMDPHYNHALFTTKPNLTYTRFSNKLIVKDGNVKASYKDLKVGDTVKMVVQDMSGKSTETEENHNPLNHPENIVILAILKIPALTADPGSFYEDIGKNMVRLEPCNTDLSGFCRAYEFLR